MDAFLAGQYRSGNLLTLAAPNTPDARSAVHEVQERRPPPAPTSRPVSDRDSYDLATTQQPPGLHPQRFTIPGQFQFGATSRYLGNFATRA